MATIKTAWELVGMTKEPHSIIRVQNIHANVQVGTDAWGRSGKVQPVLISVMASLRHSFDTASAEDVVNNSTIHYGILSKAILEAAGDFQIGRRRKIGEPALTATGHSLTLFMEHISAYLTGQNTDGFQVSSQGHKILDSSLLATLTLEIVLPKASLIGNSVSLSATTLYEVDREQSVSMGNPHCRTLKLQGLRVQTLIGVNANERLAKQIVVANIELDRWEAEMDFYNEIEEIAVKTIEESSFQTLEALANQVSDRLIRCFIIPRNVAQHLESNFYQRIRVCLEKPTAVTFADAPAVEILVDSDPAVSKSAASLWKMKDLLKAPPFPLQGRFDEWIERNSVFVE